MQQAEFNDTINGKIFEGNLTQLLKKIAKYPDRYVGLFRPSKPQSKIMQNILQSYEIRFGDAIETICEKYIEEIGFENLKKRIKSSDKRIYSVDLLFKSEDTKTIYMVEQKIRDDHDSTKKRGQYTNFSEKYEIIESIYREYDIIAVMWFVDDSLVKNKKYYEQEMANEILQKEDDGMFLKYGKEFFEISDELKSKSFWNAFVAQLKVWKGGIPEYPNINFDDPDRIDEIMKQISPSKISNTIWKRLFSDERIVSDILPVLFPTGLAFRQYLELHKDESKRGKEIREFMQNQLLNIIRRENIYGG